MEAADSLDLMSDDSDPGLRRPWGAHQLPDNDEILEVRIGPLSLWARGREDEVWLAHAAGEWTPHGEPPAREPPSEEEGWTRWPIGAPGDGIRLSPALPPRPLVVKPELSFRLLPGASARVFVRAPLWARVTVSAADRRQLTEVPTVNLSDTWWGEFVDGELGYWLPTSARRSVGPESFAPHRAVCPLDLSNRSSDELEVERVALRVGHLSIFSGDRGFWADVTRVSFQGGEEGSDVHVTGRAPEEAGSGAVRVAAPREPVSRGFRAWTFSRLRAVSGLGGLE